MSFRSPLAVARGLGSAKEGATHWWLQRLYAAAMIPLVLWLVFSLALLGRFDYAHVVAWIAQPFVSLILICLVITMFYHSSLGLYVVAEDYLHTKWMRLTVITAINIGNILLAIFSIFAILKIAFGLAGGAGA